MDDTLPMSESKGHATIDGRWLLTHAVWRNSYGSYQPETGVRDLHEIEADNHGRPRFDLIQHGWQDFAAAEAIIVKGLRKGWSPFRVGEAMDRLSRNRRR